MADPEQNQPAPAGWHLEKNWPGLVADRDGVTYTPSKLVNLAKDLNTQLTGLTNSTQGSLADLQMYGNLSYLASIFKDVKRWEGGDEFAAAITNAHTETTKIYQEIIEKLTIAVGLINAGAGNYQNANLANES